MWKFWISLIKSFEFRLTCTCVVVNTIVLRLIEKSCDGNVYFALPYFFPFFFFGGGGLTATIIPFTHIIANNILTQKRFSSMLRKIKFIKCLWGVSFFFCNYIFIFVIIFIVLMMINNTGYYNWPKINIIALIL